MKVLSNSDIAGRQNAGVVRQSGDDPLGWSGDLISHGRADSEVSSQKPAWLCQPLVTVRSRFIVPQKGTHIDSY